jgi:hypothetical protein
VEAELLKTTERKKVDEKQIDERRAALLLGISEEELRRLATLSGIGQVKKNGELEQMVYTYEELRKICVLSVPQRQ